MLTPITTWLTIHLPALLHVAAILSAGILAAMLVQRVLRRAMLHHFGLSTAIMTGKVVRNLIVMLTLFSALSALGIELKGFLAAAGVVGIAIGFASQTSLSNLISGIFLIAENAFRIGDVVTIGDMTGLVHNIGLLATQVRTFDNRLVRFPNEMLVKQPIVNVTRFPIRRLDLPVRVDYQEDPARVMAVLREVAAANPLCLDEPAAIVIFNGFGASSMDFTLGVWFEKADMLALRASILCDIKARFDREGMRIALPQLSVHAGRQTKPFPVAIQSDPVPVRPPAGEATAERQPNSGPAHA